MNLLTLSSWEFCMCSPVKGEKSGCGPVFGAELEVLDVYHACCSQPAVRSRLLDSCGMVALHLSVLNIQCVSGGQLLWCGISDR